MVLEHLNIYTQKKKKDSIHTSYHIQKKKKKLKMNHRFNIKSKTMEFLKNNIGENL